MCLAKRNARYNETIPLPVGLINGQSLGAVSGVKFGLGTMRWNGCEVLAVYNALQLQGCPRSLPVVAAEMERYAMLAGLFGVNPFALGRALQRFAVKTVRLTSLAKLRAALLEGWDCLLSYWTGRRCCSMIHTVCLHPMGAQLLVYNAYGNWDVPLSCQLSDYLKRRRMIVAYGIVWNG